MSTEVAVESGAHRATRWRSSGLRVAPAAADRDDLEVALEQARHGEDVGFMTLYRMLQPRLLRYLSVRTTEGAEDVAAETWLQVVRDLGRFRGNVDDFRGWLFTVARHRAVDAARAAKARPSVAVADVSAVQAVELAPSAEAQALEKMSTEQALRLVATLSPEIAEMVALRVIAGLDPTTVGDIVGKSAGAVRVAVHRALATLCNRPDVSPMEVNP
jgi:RNA polymerase sigma-70 factor (ECF subfamily)